MGVYDLDLEGGGNSRTAHTAFQHNRKLKPSTRVLVIAKTAHTRHQRLRIKDTYNARELAWDKATGTGPKRRAGTNQGLERSFLLFYANSDFLFPCMSDLGERGCVCAFVSTPVPFVYLVGDD